ncbi:MAG: NAD(P)-dependent oxidoreductase [Polyangiaceae bacterium]|nr:NAD(P)-dependent oxidoreductase [Polyangiaceae bacterium]
MNPVVVTGAFGGLGRAVLAELAARGLPARAFDLPTARNRLVAARLRRRHPGALEVAWGDVTRPADVERALRDASGVIHNAGVLPPTTERNPALARAVNVGGFEHLLAALRRAPVPLVYPSSYTVFGPEAGRRGIASAASPVVATDGYTSHKLACEALLRASDLPWTILRLAAAIEASASATDPAILRLMFEVDPGQPMEILHAADAARAEVEALGCEGARGKVLCVGGGKRCQIRQRDLILLMLRALAIKSVPESAFGDMPYYTCWLDTAESEALLHYQRHSFEDVARELTRRLAPLRPLLWAASPLSRQLLLRLSGPYNGRPPAEHAREIYAA